MDNIIFIVIKNIIFYIFFIIYSCTMVLVGDILSIFLTKQMTTNYVIFHSQVIRRVLYKIIGIKLIVSGLENLPKDNKYVIASKHQSMLETILFFNDFAPLVAYAFKKEVMDFLPWRPLCSKYLGIIIDRKKTREAGKSLLTGAKDLLSKGHPLAIFPEGTRSTLHQDLPLKKGIYRICKDNNVPAIPVALTTGVVWPKGKFLKFPGVVYVEFLEPIYNTENEAEFLKTLKSKIDAKTKEQLSNTPCNYFMKKNNLCIKN